MFESLHHCFPSPQPFRASNEYGDSDEVGGSEACRRFTPEAARASQEALKSEGVRSHWRRID
jgi:hypothetical protein